MTFRDDGDFIDCTKMGVGGKARTAAVTARTLAALTLPSARYALRATQAIPSLMDRVTDIAGDAEFVLLIEKDAAFMRLSEDRFYNTYPCIIVTAKGQPDVATRLFLKRVKTALNIPILGLVDSDPYGLKILSVYMSGSKNMSYDRCGRCASADRGGAPCRLPY